MSGQSPEILVYPRNLMKYCFILLYSHHNVLRFYPRNLMKYCQFDTLGAIENKDFISLPTSRVVFV